MTEASKKTPEELLALAADYVIELGVPLKSPVAIVLPRK